MLKKQDKIDQVSIQTVKFFGGKKDLIAFLNEIVRRGGEMLATDALGYEWWPVHGLMEKDPAFQDLVKLQKKFVMQKADEVLCNHAMNGFEEVVMEGGEIVKETRKFNDRTLLSYLKANHPLYKGLPKDDEEEGEEFPEVIIKRF